MIVVEGEEINRDCAEDFSAWITAPATQPAIESFGAEEYGEPLFIADAAG